MGQKQTKPFIYKSYTDIWEYDPNTNTWTRKSDFPGPGRLMIKGFLITNKLYAGFGYIISAYGENAGSNEYQTDLYEYDPVANQWSKKNDSYLGRGDIFFVIKDKMYAVNPEYRTLNRYNQLTDTWFASKWKKNDVGPNHTDMIGNNISFSAGDKEYFITTIHKKDKVINQLWELDPNSVTWKPKNNLPDPGSDTISAFSTGEKNYAIRGGQEVLEYNPGPDSWTLKKKIPAEHKDFYYTFGIGEKIYGFSKYEFWEFIP